MQQPDFTNSELFEKVIDEPILCMLLNKDLSVSQLAQLAKTFYVVDIEHEGQTRWAVMCGEYKFKPQMTAKLLDPWGNLVEADQ